MKLHHDEMLSSFSFDIDLRHYNKVLPQEKIFDMVYTTTTLKKYGLSVEFGKKLTSRTELDDLQKSDAKEAEEAAEREKHLRSGSYNFRSTSFTMGGRS